MKRSILTTFAAQRIKELESALESLLNESTNVIYGKLPSHSKKVVFNASNTLHK